MERRNILQSGKLWISQAIAALGMALVPDTVHATMKEISDGRVP
jgi:hypothetical protein